MLGLYHSYSGQLVSLQVSAQYMWLNVIKTSNYIPNMMQSYLVDNPTSTVTDLYQHAEHILDTIHGAAPCVHTSAVVALPALPAVTVGIRSNKPTIVSARQ
jgi:hypothetical protein